MAVFKPDLSFTTLQDKQLKALESLNNICSKDFDINKNIYNSIEKLPDVIYRATNLIVHGIDAIWNDKGFTEFHSSLENQFSSLGNSIDTAEKSAAKDAQGIQKSLEYVNDNLEDPPNPPEPDPSPDPTKSIEDLIDVVKDLGKRLWDRSVKEADMYSDLYNQTIKYIGTDKQGSQEFRRDIVDIVSDLNGELGGIGGKLDPKESLQTMLAISNSTNISNVETLEALTKPILLAQETTNLNTAELAKLGARLYTRYNFTSTSLEKLVDNIRNVSQGKDVSEDAMIQAAASVEKAAGVFYQGNKDSIEAMLNATSTAQAFYESNYVDGSQYFDDMNTILTGNQVDISKALMKYGEYSDEIRSLVASGDQESILEAYELMLKGVSERTTYQKELFQDLTQDMITDAQNWAVNNGSSMEEFLDSINYQTSAEQRAADKYVSLEQQVYNKLSEATSYLATIQENLGIGMSDITLGVSVLGNVLGILGGKGATGGAAGSILGSLGKAGPVGLLVAGLTAVLSGAILDTIKSIEEINKSISEDRKESLEEGINLEQEAADEMLGYMYKYTYENGEKIWEQVLVNQSDYKNEAGVVDTEKFHADQQKMLDEYNADLLNKAKNPEGFWTNFFDGFTFGITKAIRVGSTKGMIEDNTEFNKIQDEAIGSELWQLYWNNGLLSDTDAQNYFTEYYDYIKGAYDEGKILMTTGSEKGTTVDRSTLKYPGSYDVGTNYVTHDQLAYIHKGEAITPAEYNPAANMNELERLREERESENSFVEVLKVLVEIKDYMEYWKKDNERRDMMSTNRSMNSQRVNLMRYSALPY